MMIIIIIIHLNFLKKPYYIRGKFFFLKDLGMECDIPENYAIWLVSAIGLSNTAGRLLSGVIKNFININSAMFALVCLCFSGIYSAIFFFCCNIYCITSFSCIFGVFTGDFFIIYYYHYLTSFV